MADPRHPARTRHLTLARLPIALLCLVGLGLVPLAGCDEQQKAPPGFVKVDLGGQTYTLQLALDDDTRTKGLGGRESLPEKGGMLFVFPRARRLEFIMRDCFMDIDIIFLDPNGRILKMHHMPMEPPRGENEGEAGDWDPMKAANRRYEARLKHYPSAGPAEFAIEIAGGELEKLKLHVGEQVQLDTAGLKAQAH
ncbi:MAG: DUF192 domain-containing protein [Phycisphaeraceae bacterium]|nr:MAG: DUF192 domain-containing protein [Phycisphaeraceae bacterium]